MSVGEHLAEAGRLIMGRGDVAVRRAAEMEATARALRCTGRPADSIEATELEQAARAHLPRHQRIRRGVGSP